MRHLPTIWNPSPYQLVLKNLEPNLDCYSTLWMLAECLEFLVVIDGGLTGLPTWLGFIEELLAMIIASSCWSACSYLSSRMFSTCSKSVGRTFSSMVFFLSKEEDPEWLFWASVYHGILAKETQSQAPYWATLLSCSLFGLGPLVQPDLACLMIPHLKQKLDLMGRVIYRKRLPLSKGLEMSINTWTLRKGLHPTPSSSTSTSSTLPKISPINFPYFQFIIPSGSWWS